MATVEPLQLPFKQHAPLAPRSWWQRAFRRSLPLQAGSAIEHLLAERGEGEIWPAEISRILEGYGVAGAEARRVLVTLWREALEAFLHDDALSADEIAYLAHLRRALGISEDEAIAAEQKLVHPRYSRAIQHVLADGQLEPRERESLERLGDTLQLSPTIRRELYREPAGSLLSRVIEGNLSDGRLSPEEDRAFHALAEQLGVRPEIDRASRAALERAALLWRLENEPLPALDVPISLQRGEQCHFFSSARWLEYRKQTRTVGYASHGVSFRIARGVYYRVGATRPQRITSEDLTEIDGGMLYITNKRVLFDGTRKNSTLRLSSLIGFEPYSDGLVLEKGTGRSPHLILSSDAEIAAVILARVLAEA